MSTRLPRLGLEILEGREVPATFVNSTTLTDQDLDGDEVTVKFSKGILGAGNDDWTLGIAGDFKVNEV